MQARALILSLAAALALAAVVYGAAFSVFRGAELTRSEGALSLYRGTVVSEIERFSHLPFVLARDPVLIAATKGGPTEALNARLAAFAEAAGLDAVYVMDREGLTIAASNAGTPASFIGASYGFRPYFREAMEGRQGQFYGIGATTGEPGYFIANPVEGGQAVVAIKLDLARLEAAWREAGAQVFLANSDGVVILASDPAWRYRASRPLTAAQRERIAADRQFPGQPLDPLDWETDGPDQARIDGGERLHLTAGALPHDWRLHYFASLEPARTRALLAAVIALVAAALAVIGMQLRTGRATLAALRRSEAAEAQLREVNARLEGAQEELARTSRLAALGELAASVTHELGQPIAALRNHLAVAELDPAAAPRALDRIGGLADRMEGITRQLRFFARPGDAAQGPVDLGAALAAALELVRPNLDAGGIDCVIEAPEGVLVWGDRLRLEQVLTNLLRNAVDAMEETGGRLRLVLGTLGDTAWLEVRDRGHGLGGATLGELSEPFVSNRASGEGMGLGLAISTSILREHRGRLGARDRDGGGAVFRVELPLWQGQAREAAE